MPRYTRRQVLAGAGAAIALCSEGGAMPITTPVAEEWIVIPAGPFLMGTTPERAAALARTHGYHVSWFEGETPQRTVELPAFAIQKYPVTNRQFAAFCRATGYAPRPHWHGPEPPEAVLDHPVTYVNRPDARAYAQWKGLRLPTEAEWEKAARGEHGRLYPWGDRFDPAACQCRQRPLGAVPEAGRVASGRAHPDAGQEGPRTARVDAHPRGASPYGVMDLVGNAAEWCADDPGPNCGFIKGGCWLTEDPLNLRPAARNMSGFDTNAMPYYGFRCVKEVR